MFRAVYWFLLILSIGFSENPPVPSPPPNPAPTVTPEPDPLWQRLAPYQRTITRQEFESLLWNFFDPFEGMRSQVTLTDEKFILWPDSKNRTTPLFELAFAAYKTSAVKPPRTYRLPSEFRAITTPADKPLQGLRIAIDPGHIGGKWGPMQNRSVLYPGLGRVQEGDMNLITAGILKKNLTALGAEVFLTREAPEPVTLKRPEDLLGEARERIYKKYPDLKSRYATLPIEDQNHRLGSRLRLTSEFLFYRYHEIRDRAEKIRNNFKPDLTIVLYINATASSGHGQTVGVNQNVFFINGSYTKEEARDPEQQSRLLYKLLDRVTPVEKAVVVPIAEAFTRITKLPPVPYGDTKSSRAISESRYVAARNLAANREYDGPVVTTEPYFMNNRVVVRRLLAGDYEGTQTILGKPYPSIFREYAQAVQEGLLSAYRPVP